jgi:WhiB family redox-sensing transcriptional regulator
MPPSQPTRNARDTLSNAQLMVHLYVETMLSEPHYTSLTHDLDPTPAFTPLEGRARCSDGAGTLASLFFSDEDLDIARAKAICRTCALRADCFENAIDRNEAYGVWGGTLLIEGEAVRFARRRGRPPAHRIEFVADEVQIPDHLVA